MTDPLSGETLWRFKDGLDLQQLESKLRAAQISYHRHATTVSYFVRLGDEPRLDSYEFHAVYTGGYLSSGEPEVDKSHVRNSYSIFRAEGGTRWIAETAGEEISEEDFYSMVLYERPDRMISLQEISFETTSGRYLAELNLESGLFVLVALDGADEIPFAVEELVHSKELHRTSYISELLEHNGGPLNSSALE